MMSAPRVVRGAAKALGMAVVVATALAIVVLTRPAQPSLRANMQPASPKNGLQEGRRMNIGGEAFSLALDESRGSAWFATFSPSGPDQLHELDLKLGSIRDWPLPDVDYNGFVSHVALAQDGAVWVSEPYALVRFDPQTEASSTLRFDLTDADQVENALDPGAPLPGTWISAFGVSGNSVVVARNNVSALAVVSPSLSVSARLTLPETYAGAQSLVVASDGSMLVAPGATHTAGVGHFLPDGSLANVLPIAGTRVVSLGPDVVVVDGVAGPAVLTSTSKFADARSLLWPSTSVAPGTTPGDERWRFAVTGANEAVYDPYSNRVTLSIDGTLRSLDLPKTTGHVTSPTGEQTTVTSHARVNDIVVTQSGTTWYLDGSNHSLVELIGT